MSRDRLVSFGILPNVNLIKLNRDAKQETSVCSRTTRLKNNQVKKAKKSFFNPQNGKSEDKCAAAIVKTGPQLACVSQDSESLVSQKRKQSRGNPMQKVLGPIRRIRFTQTTLCQAIIRENKGTSLGKIQVKNPHQRSPFALKFEDGSQEKTECARR